MLKIHVLGKLDISLEGEHLRGLESRKVEELLCYLLINRERTISREVVSDLLWGEINPEQAKSYLRKSLWQLQSILDRFLSPDQERLILADSDWIRINPRFELWLDIAILEDSYLSVQGKPGRDLNAEQAEHLKFSIGLYRGNLLEGWYQDWCLYERERLQFFFIALLDKLMDYYAAHDEIEQALVYGNKILRYDRARERTHRWMMRLYYVAGDRIAGLRQYERCVAALREELDVEPARKTRQLYELIRSDSLNEETIIGLPSPLNSGPAGELSHLEGISNNLLQIKTLLAGIQDKLESELSIIQEVLKNR